MTPDLELLIADVYAAAGAFLPADGAATAVGVELTPMRKVVLLAPVDGAPRVVARVPAAVEHFDLVHAAERLAGAWVDRLGESVVKATAYSIDRRGTSLRVYCHADGSIALALGDSKRTVPIAARCIGDDATWH